jgi:hypothetical protein
MLASDVNRNTCTGARNKISAGSGPERIVVKSMLPGSVTNLRRGAAALIPAGVRSAFTPVASEAVQASIFGSGVAVS